jgi:hypothetical protein
VHAHLSVRARICKRAAIANVTALDHPYLAGRRADIGRKLISNQAQRMTEARTAADLVEDLANPVLS